MTNKLHLNPCPRSFPDANDTPEWPWLRFPYFLVAGGVSTIFHWSTMAGLLACGLSGIWASALGATVGALTNYWLQKRYVFRCAKAHEHVVFLYLLSVAWSWTANLTLLWLLYQWIGLNIAYSQLLTTLLVCVINFHVQRRVFS